MWIAASTLAARRIVLALALACAFLVVSSGANAASQDRKAPSTPSNLLVTSVSASSISLSWTASHDNKGGSNFAGYGLYKNTVIVTTTTTTKYTFTGLSCGTSYTLGVDAYDGSDNRSQVATIIASTSSCSTTTSTGTSGTSQPTSSSSDTTPPTSPSNLSSTGATATSVSVSWTASTDNVGVTGYDLYRSGVAVGTTAGTTYTFGGLTCGTSYTLGVDAYDSAGNRSTVATVTAATGPCSSSSDTSPPTSPTKLSPTGVTATSVAVSWTASTDNVGVTGYDLYRNGSKVGTTTNLTYTFGSLSCGTSYTFGVDAYDAAGNRSTVATVTASTSPCPDTTAPSVPTGLVVTGSTATSIAIMWNASFDNVAVAGYDVYVNGTRVGTTVLMTYTFTSLACGTSYTLGVDAYDGAGNRSTITTIIATTSACADLTAPTAPTNLVAGSATATSLPVSWTASTDNIGVAGYDLYLNGSKVNTTTSLIYTFGNLSCGTSYSLGVDAYDAAGNRSKITSVTAATSQCPTTTTVGTSLPSPLPQSTGATFYVSTSGSDSNPGTATAPWRTIQKALNVLQPGQQALVRGGTYTENLTMAISGTVTAPITVAAYPGETVVLHAASAGDSVTLNGVRYADWYPVVISGSYFRLHGFVIENAQGPSSANVYIKGTASHVEVSANEIRYGQNNGIFTERTTSYLYALGNKIHDNGSEQTQSAGYQSHGIYLEGGNDLIANNVIYNHPYGFGLQIWPVNHNTVVVDNTIAASGHSSIVLGAANAGDISAITIRNNILYSDHYGIELYANCPESSYADHNDINAYSVAPIMSGCGSGLDTSGGNIVADPLFVDYASRDLDIQSGSPANDDASLAYSEQTDFAGVARPQGFGADMGAYER